MSRTFHAPSGYQPWTDAEEAFWAYLARHEQYRELCFSEFRGYDGNAQTWDFRRGLLPLTEEMPGIGARGLQLANESSDNAYQQTALVRIEMCFDTQSLQGVRAPCERAAAIVHGILNSDDARQTKLRSKGLIEDYQVETMTLEYFAPPEHPSAVLYWVFAFDLRLEMRRTHVI